MVTTPLLLYFFSPVLLGLVGVLAEKAKAPRLRDGAAVAVGLWGVQTIWALAKTGPLQGETLVISLLGKPPLGACLEVDLMGLYFAGTAVVLCLLATLYSLAYMGHEDRLTEFYTLVSCLTVGMVGVSLAGDFYTLFIFWELMGLSSYSLVGFRKSLAGPIEASFKYMVMGSVGSVVLFFGMAFLYGMAGTLNFAHLSTVLRDAPLNPWMMVVFATLLVGMGVKAAIVPMHTWLPDAHPEAPSPISAILSGIVIETGLYALIRVLYLVYEPAFFKAPIALLAAATMTLGNILALRQDDVKRMLAYSSIAQVGYMLIGVSTGLAYGLLGTLLHVFNHSFMKGAAFLAVGSIDHQAGTRDLKKLRGVGRRMPLTTLAIIVSFLGLAGVPGTSGFISKFTLFSSAIGAGMGYLALLGVLNSSLSVAYYARVIMTLLSGEPGKDVQVGEASPIMVLVTLAMALVIIWLGLFPGGLTALANEATKPLFEGLTQYIGAVLG
ncbi:MAG TPA: hypothetical protein ENF19_00380 [Candidatus Bathyarchaeota archaeon]|nr:hypothetical protein [Candidatus Bathyarchaeota archaeon]